jgi:hypothetical protein
LLGVEFEDASLRIRWLSILDWYRLEA